jgi:dephospho-CoA kinase
MFLLGLTGDIAAGKSTVAQLLQKRGAVLLDADALVRELYSDREFAARVAALFQDAPRVLGNHGSLLSADGSIDRRVLGSIVFVDPAALRKLEALVHPAVMELRDRKIAALALQKEAPRVVVLEAVKLVESGHAEKCDALWWIQASLETQMHRLVHDRGMDEGAARARLLNQPEAKIKLELLQEKPFTIIGNDGNRQQLEEAVEAAWNALPLHQPDASTRDGKSA